MPTCAGERLAFAQLENNCFTETCSGSKAGLYLRLIDCVYHSTLGLRVMKKRRRCINEIRHQDKREAQRSSARPMLTTLKKKK